MNDLELALEKSIVVNKNPNFYELAVGKKVIYKEEVLEVAKAYTNNRVNYYLLNTRDNKQLSVPVWDVVPYNPSVEGLVLKDLLDAMHIITHVTLCAVNEYGYSLGETIIECSVDDIPEDAFILSSKVTHVQPEGYNSMAIDYVEYAE